MTQYFVDQQGRYLGGFDGAEPPEGAIEVPYPPVDARMVWDGEQFGVDLAAAKGAKNDQINTWRAAANLSTFPHAGKQIACDTLSRSDIDGVANHIALFGQFPVGFPGAWKAVDNTLILLADVDAFRAMYASMTAQGTENFNHSQSLKAALAMATTPEEVAAIEW
jgi:hypothetical protein